MRLLIITILVIPLIHAAEDVDLPRSVERIMESLDRDVERARDDYMEAIAAAKEDAVEELEEEQTRYTSRNDLDTAVAIRDLKNMVTKQDYANNQEPEGKQGADLLGGKDENSNKYPFLGKWIADGRKNWELREGGVFIDAAGSTSKWEIQGDKVIITFVSGNNLNLPVNIEGDEWTGYHKQHDKFVTLRRP